MSGVYTSIYDYTLLRSWGGNANGQLGNGTIHNALTPLPIILRHRILKINAGHDCTAILAANGRIITWGINNVGQSGTGSTASPFLTPVFVSTLSGLLIAIDVSLKQSHALALRNDGTVWAWGRNGSGQLGDGSTTTRLTPVQILSLANIEEITAGFNHTISKPFFNLSLP